MNNSIGIDTDKIELERYKKLYPLPRSSYSQLSSFLSCPHTFYLSYMTGNFKRNGNKYTELGSLLHSVFERQGKQLIANPEKPFTKAEAFKMYNRDYFRIDKKHFDDKEDWLKLYQKGVTAIHNYYSAYEDAVPLYIEKQFLTEIGEGIPPIKGFVDRIDGDPNDVETWVLTDYKTGSQPKSKDYLRNDFQLGIYVAQIYALHGKFPKAVEFYHPVPAKAQTAVHMGDGRYRFTGQREPVVEFNLQETILDVQAVVMAIGKAVESDTWIKKKDSWGCRNCFHFEECAPFSEQEQGWANC